MEKLTSIERYIIELIEIHSPSVDELMSKTNFSKKLILNIVNDFIASGLIVYKGPSIQIKDSYALEKLNSFEAQKHEATELMTSLFNSQRKKTTFKKIFISERDEKFLKGLMAQIDMFISGLDYKKKDNLKRKVIFWGEEDYEKLCMSTIVNK